MGYGTFGGGDVELIVSVRYKADSATLAAWADCFEEASKILHATTGGAVRFARIYLYNDDTWWLAPDADVWLLDPQSGITSYFDTEHPDALGEEVFGESNIKMALADTAVKSPFTVLHEFGHYAFGLGDEYIGASGKDLQCAGDADPACIMGAKPKWVGGSKPNVPFITATGPDWGRIIEFCNDANHRADADSNHNQVHPDLAAPGKGKSCAAVILDTRGVQVASGVAAKKRADYQSIAWGPSSMFFSYAAVVENRIHPNDAAVLDPHSESWWHEAAAYAEAVPATKEKIHLVSYGTGVPRPGFEPTAGLQDAIKNARGSIRASDDRPAAQTMLLFSTGQEPIQDPRRIGDELGRQGIRVCSIGTGRDRAGLQQLAEQSKGAYYEVVLGGDPIRDAERIRAEIMRVYDERRFGPPALHASLEAFRRGAQTVVVGQGAAYLKLAFSHTLNADFELAIRRPEGEVLDLARAGVVHGSPERGFRAITIEEPTPGNWEVSVRPPAEPFALTLNAYSFHPHINVGISGASRLYRAGDQVRLQLVVQTPTPVVDLNEVLLQVRAPASGDHLIEKQFTSRRSGVYTASFKVNEPGAHEVQVDVANEGDAKPNLLASAPGGLEPPEIPRFRRTKRFQVHVVTGG
ncbi:MAG: hypothetical protein WCE62_16245 [Polyangiales bacterium]